MLGFQKRHDIPLAHFAVDDVQIEYDRLRAAGVEFTQLPTDLCTVTVAVFDDTCGNLTPIVTQT